MNIALIIAGGSGNRMGQDIPKQFMHVDDCPIIIHTMMCFQNHPDIQGIAVVCLNGWETVLQSYANQFGITKLKWIFPGGNTGMESIHNGIYGLKEVGCVGEDLVLIHDSVRPLLSQDIISSNIAICKASGYAVTGIKCREAILESEDGFTSCTSIPRDKLIRTQTPQTFRLKNIIAAHEEAKEKGITDSVASCTLMAELGGKEMHLVSYGLRHGMKRFLFVSSGEVYGESDGRIFTEDYSGYVDCMSPRSCYPSSKRAAETLCVSYMSEYGAGVVIARPCHTYGPDFSENDNRVYAQFIRNALRGEDIVMKSTGSQFRSWSYVVDCASAILYILLKGKNGEAYNIADEASNISIRELAEITASMVGRKVVMEVPDETERKGYNPVSKSVYSVEKLKTLGWQPVTSIKDGIRKTINHLQSKP